MSVDFVNDIKILVKYATDNLPSPIAKVLHVGGSSRMPLIKSMLIQMFPNAEQCCEVHPEEVVAVGAAYYSYHLAQQQK
uniref:Heat shock protein 70 n=1 Tax=Panagrolaimus davidi TaxID=227884 RepID=A0A914R118_9BILA